ncbi:MAG TPA: hypothetical protein VMV25_02255 [Steroidobacteraceae bacterium]|nr:hypothetical protein [Steroidobacteraceae bacterium]
MRKPTLTALLAAVSLAACGAAIAADGSTTISGKSFIDLTNINQQSDGTKTAASGTGVDVKRFYLSFTHDFDETWSVNATTDFNYTSSSGQTQLYIKKAYLQAKIADAFVARLGSADMPWIPFVEDLYGYRFVENTLIDRLKFGTSADWGLHAGGKVLDGRLSYAASVVNGNGYKNPTRSQSMDFEGRVAFVPVRGLTIAAGAYSGKLGKDVAGATQTVRHTANRFDALVAYVNSDLRLGAEYFSATDWNQVTAAPTDKSDGYSIWASYNFQANYSVFARGDQSKPKKDLSPGLKDTYYDLGLAYRPRKNIDVALAYKHDKVENGSWGTSNGTIGGVPDGKYDEIGVWAQVAF